MSTASSESNIENEPGYYTTPPSKWLERLIIFFCALTLLLMSGMAMVGAAFLLVINGYGT